MRLPASEALNVAMVAGLAILVAASPLEGVVPTIDADRPERSERAPSQGASEQVFEPHDASPQSKSAESPASELDGGANATGAGDRAPVQAAAPDAPGDSARVDAPAPKDVAKDAPVAGNQPPLSEQIVDEPRAAASDKKDVDAFVAPIVRRRPASVPLSFKVPADRKASSKPKDAKAEPGGRSALGAPLPAPK